MRIRISFLLYVPLVAVLVTGCSEQSSAPAEPAKTPVAAETPTKGGSKTAKRKPKDINALVPPTGVAP
jgi:hypothetical protein